MAALPTQGAVDDKDLLRALLVAQRRYGDLNRLYKEIEAERLSALTRFRDDIRGGKFPDASESVKMPEDALEEFLNRIET